MENIFETIKRDYDFEIYGFGTWCTIQCKPLFRKPHLKVEAGAASWNNALKKAFELWNNMCLSKEE